VVSGAHLLHFPLERWHGDETRAEAVHKMAAVAKEMSPSSSLRMFSAGEIASGAILVMPRFGLALIGRSEPDA